MRVKKWLIVSQHFGEFGLEGQRQSKPVAQVDFARNGEIGRGDMKEGHQTPH
jgi:hypothetical protein